MFKKKKEQLWYLVLLSSHYLVLVGSSFQAFGFSFKAAVIHLIWGAGILLCTLYVWAQVTVVIWSINQRE